METKARVVPLWAWLSILRRGLLRDSHVMITVFLKNYTEAGSRLIPSTQCLIICVAVGATSRHSPALQHHCHTASSLFIYFGPELAYRQITHRAVQNHFWLFRERLTHVT